MTSKSSARFRNHEEAFYFIKTMRKTYPVVLFILCLMLLFVKLTFSASTVQKDFRRKREAVCDRGHVAINWPRILLEPK